MSLDADIEASVDLLGKSVTDLQTGLAISEDHKITGTLKLVTGYTGFSGDPTEQSGNYMAVHAEVEGVEGATIIAELVGGLHGPKELDADGVAIIRVTDTTQTLKLTAKADGYDDTTIVYDLSGLTLAGE